jgi:transposase InsO family protein
MVEFVKEHIIYRFGIPQTIATDQGAQFVSLEFREFAESMGIKLFNSSPYYAQADGQAEASNKIMIKLIQKKIDQKPRRWHSVLSEALWAYRMAPMELQKLLLMNWFMGTTRFYLGRCNHIQGEWCYRKI